jgi:hypothetical protein
MSGAVRGGLRLLGRDENITAAEPITGIDHRIADNPGLVIEIKVFDLADLPW